MRDDFPRTRRGYDPDEVRRHLKQIADLVEELHQERLMAPVADTAASQVRSIIQAAERSGAELETAAREQAEQIRAEAERFREEADADTARAQAEATAEAAERVQEVHEASARLLERAKSIERALATMQEEAVALSAAVLPEESELEPAVDERYEPGEEAEPGLAVAGAAPAGADAEEPDAAGTDMEDIRLIALNMALNGSSREETAAYLKANFEIDDPDALLDGVYSEART